MSPAIATDASFYAPNQAAATDLDGDGDLDALAAILFYQNQIRWYENDGSASPSWTPRTISTASAQGARAVFAGDMDSDGDTDVLSGLFPDDSLAWFENDGAPAPTWTERTIGTATPFGDMRSVFAADVDSDGDMDALAAWSSIASDVKIAWYENSGDTPPLWTAHTISTTVYGAQSVFAADIDSDGDLDVLSASATSAEGKIAWNENNGGSPPSWTERSISTARGRSVFAADVDSDGDQDVLSASLDDEVTWYQNNGASPPGWTTRNIATLDGVASVFAGDLDSDGDVDALAGAAGTVGLGDKLVWYESDGGSPPAWTAHSLSTATDAVWSVSAADLDGDGQLDILAAWDFNSSHQIDDICVAGFENGGGQFSFATTDTAPPALLDGGTHSLLTIGLRHNGRPGDPDLEWATLELLFEESAGDPLTNGEANALIDNLRIYRDTGSGIFEGSDTLVTAVAFLSLSAGKLTLAFTDGDPNVQVAAGTPAAFFVVFAFVVFSPSALAAAVFALAVLALPLAPPPLPAFSAIRTSASSSVTACASLPFGSVALTLPQLT